VRHPHDGASIRGAWLEPEGAHRPVLLYIHGGGFVFGSIRTHGVLIGALARAARARTFALEYRLAPEHRFPTAVLDTWAALHWLAGEGARWLGMDPTRLAVGGDSAGGTLSAVAALHARDVGLPLALQLLVTPGTSPQPDTASHRLFGHGFLLDAAGIEWFFDHYIERGHRFDWRFAPLVADDLEGVAPACVILAECDPLVDEGIAYADRLRAAGVQVELELYRGLTHDFIKMSRVLKEASHAQQLAADALERAWHETR
jgi:acetyl esterase